jgi:hypothetical protein
VRNLHIYLKDTEFLQHPVQCHILYVKKSNNCFLLVTYLMMLSVAHHRMDGRQMKDKFENLWKEILWPYWGTVLESIWRDWGNPRKSQARQCPGSNSKWAPTKYKSSVDYCFKNSQFIYLQVELIVRKGYKSDVYIKQFHGQIHKRSLLYRPAYIRQIVIEEINMTWCLCKGMVLPHSQVPTTGPYPELYESNLQPHTM